MDYTILDASNDFAELSNTIGRFEAELCKEPKINFESDDFKLVTLNTIQQYLLSLCAYIRAFVELQRRIDNKNEFLRILNLGITEEQMEEARIVYKFPIESLVIKVHFQIDSFFGELCELWGKPRYYFGGRMKEVLNRLGDKEKLNSQKTLRCLTFFRNSFHNNGYHSTRKARWKNGVEPQKGVIDESFEFDGLKIEFRHKEAVAYDCGWKSVHLLVRGSVNVLVLVIRKLYLTEQTPESSPASK